jgi:hypothetical protein
MPLYLAYRVEQKDLACGIPGILALGPKLQFQYHFEIFISIFSIYT